MIGYCVKMCLQIVIRKKILSKFVKTLTHKGYNLKKLIDKVFLLDN